LKQLVEKIETWHGESVIDEELLDLLEKDLEKAKELDDSEPDKQSLVEGKEYYYNLVNCLKEIADSCGIAFDFVISINSLFSSNFSKSGVREIPIFFAHGPKKFGEITTVLESKESDDTHFFYVFYRQNTAEELDISEFVNQLMSKINQKDFPYRDIR